MNEKLLKKTSIRITLMLIIIFAIIGVLTYKLYTDMNERKDRVVYTSEQRNAKRFVRYPQTNILDIT